MRGWDLILPGWRWLYEPQFGVYTPWGAVSTGGLPFSFPVCWGCRRMEGILIRGWDLIPSGWRWLYEPQVGVSTLWGRYRSGGTSFSSPVWVGL